MHPTFSAKRTLFFCFLAVFFSVDNLTAQNPAVLQTVSPYSRFGLGELNYLAGPVNQGLGGGGIGLRNDSLLPIYINHANPASLTSVPITTYEISLVSNTVQLQNATSTGTFNRTSLGQMTLAFPVKPWWGASLGFAPYSTVGYNVVNSAEEPNIGTVTYKYQGSGGINQVYTSHAFRPFTGLAKRYQLSDKYELQRRAGDTTAMKTKMARLNALGNISIGVQVSYLFGATNNVRRDEFPDSLFSYNTRVTRSILFRDVYATFGLQYGFIFHKALNPIYENLPDSAVTDKSVFKNTFTYTAGGKSQTAPLFVKRNGIRGTFGLVFAPATELTVSYQLLADRYKISNGGERILDTVLNFNGIPGRVRMPPMFGVGFAFKRDYRWMFQADLMAQQWGSLTILDVNPGLRNSLRATAGFQIQPKPAGRGNFFTAIQYRIGARYHQTSLTFNNVGLNEVAVNLGFAFPLPYRTRLGEPVSRVSLALEAGQRGTIENNLVKESFFRVSLGVTINDKWFNRYRFD
ncbi:MAG: hypothetical protein MUC87_11395 [Bacteroidia bacterium]|jgi:hypothetical protein|nr:hypothetical protein [Bacteroidia bacterium]